MKINLIGQIFPELADEDLGEDDVFVLESIAEAKKNEEDKLRVTLILSLKDSMPALTKVLKIIEVSSTYACILQLLLGFHKVVCMLYTSSYSTQKSSFLLEQSSRYFDYKIELF